MPRIPRVRGLSALQLAVAPPTRASFAAVRTVSTSGAVQGKNTDWIRKQLWKGEAPGPEDPYTQRVQAEETSNLPDEALQRQPRDRTPWAVQESRLVLPPRRSEAVSEKQLQSEDPTYVPATFVEGLEEIETVKSWWEQPGHWGEESAFKGFASAEKVHDQAVLEVYLRRAAVEALALKEGGLLEEWAARKWNAGERADMDQTLAVQLSVKDGKAALSGDVQGLAGRLTAEVLGGEEAETISAEEAKEIVKSWDPSWKNLELDNHLKFAIRKRLYQLTGNLIPDAKLGAALTIRHLHTLIAKPPKQEKLAAVLSSRGLLAELSNVTLHDRKLTPIDKEVSVGRWKVIEEELTKRGLPVTGTMGLKKNKERQWLSGRA